ncbi:MAG: ATP-binding protein [Longimicrobiales bacterium]|nr:ATP-binding protein [Longimicrobiales bacterium]
MEESQRWTEVDDLAARVEEAQKAFRDRPHISIRTRLTLGSLAWFLFTLVLAVGSMINLSNMASKLVFTEAVDHYTFEVQQARRFEKNYFLYRTNLLDALDHVDSAQSILNVEREDIESVIGVPGFQNMTANLLQYEGLLARLRTLDQTSPEGEREELASIEAGLRERGAVIVEEAEDLVERERQAVKSMLAISQQIPLAILLVLIGLIGYTAYLIRKQMLAPLDRMMKATQRIAGGDFTPITPIRKYHDEFSHLAVAMNTMMIQLAQRQELLVRAHKLKAVGTLTAGVAHELNNPINNIMLTASILQEDYTDLTDDDRLDMVKDLVGESERAQKIVRNLLDFARESTFQLQPVNPQRLVEETLRLATNQIKLAKVKVRGEIDSNLPPVYGDFQQLTQVMLNLVLNALDAMPNGGTLTIALRTPSGRDQIAMEVTDTGIGMPEQVLANVFDPFFTTKSAATGTGLGLSVSLGIIRQHGGDILVRSKVGEGTTFTIQLPVAMVPAMIPESKEIDPDEIPIE